MQGQTISQPQQDIPSIQPQQGVRTKKKLNGTAILIALLTVLLIISGVLGYLYLQEKKKTDNPVEAATEETERLKEAVSRHMLLPDGDPAIATIIDIEKLKGQNPDFYAKAENGDRLLVFKNKAVLYDPDKDLILNVAPIVNPNLEGDSQVAGESDTADTENDQTTE